MFTQWYPRAFDCDDFSFKQILQSWRAPRRTKTTINILFYFFLRSVPVQNNYKSNTMDFVRTGVAGNVVTVEPP